MPLIRLTGDIDLPQPRRAGCAAVQPAPPRRTRANPACLGVVPDPDVAGRGQGVDVFRSQAARITHRARTDTYDSVPAAAGGAASTRVAEVKG